MMLLLAACSGQPAQWLTQTAASLSTAAASMTPPAGFRLTEQQASRQRTRASAPTATVTSAAEPTATPVPLPTSTRAARSPSPYPALEFRSELPVLDSSGSADLHGLILFHSRAPMPFPFNPETERTGLARFGGADHASLWALTPDGQQAGRISPDGFDFAMLPPPAGGSTPDGGPLLVTYGFSLNQPGVQTVTLPADPCSPAADPGSAPACDQIALSPDGRYLGFRYGPDNCGRSLRVIDRQSGETVLDPTGNIHGWGFLANGWISYNSGHCEGSFSTFFNPASGETRAGGGALGSYTWAPDGSSYVVTAGAYMAYLYSGMWGYRLEDGAVFQPEAEPRGRSAYLTMPRYLPDSSAFLYQSFSYATDADYLLASFDRPMQLVLYDLASGQSRVAAGDDQHHYRLCLPGEPNCSTEWHGDWIRVQRLPFEPFSLPIQLDSAPELALGCLLTYQGCAPTPEPFALNVQTGALRPWDPASLPAPLPTATPGPDLARPPVYRDPAGQYLLTTGPGGRSLWMVPRSGPPQVWVTSGEGFFYLP